MNIDDITTKVRPRKSWESVDLGFRMIQTWARPITGTWLLFVFPVFVLINLLLWQHPVWALLLMWWLKPLFDRIPLYIVSHAVFGDIPRVRQVLRQIPGLLKVHIFKTLFWYRLDPARGFNMPVWQLEGLQGKQRATRANVLQKGVHGTAISLTYFCLFIQVVLFFACYLLLSMFIPANVEADHVSILFDGKGAVWPGLLLNLMHFISLSLIEPFYVAGSFALYLNRRTHLEAWDIELTFRQLAKRITATPTKQNSSTHRASLSSVAVLLCCVVLSLPLLAENVSAASAISNSRAQQLITEVLSEKEFDHTRTQQGWFLKKDLFKDNNKQDHQQNFEITWISSIFSYFIGNIVQVLFWAALIIAVIYLLIRFQHYLPLLNLTTTRRRTKDSTPDVLFGLSLNPDSLPEDVGHYAWLLWQQGKLIAALSLLYRGALSTLVNRDGLKLSNSATEGDCVKILKHNQLQQQYEHTQAQEIIVYFQRLTNVWTRAAYADRFPNNEQAQRLCENWGQYFKEANEQ